MFEGLLQAFDYCRVAFTAQDLINVERNNGEGVVAFMTAFIIV